MKQIVTITFQFHKGAIRTAKDYLSVINYFISIP